MKKLLLVLVLIGLGLAGLAYWLTVAYNRSAEGDHFTTLPVEYGSLREVVSATGLVQPREALPVGTELAGKVVAVLADFNQVVEEGDVLLRLDDRMARARLKQAELAVEEASAGVKQAEAALDTARKALKRVQEQSREVRLQTDVDLAQSHVKTAAVAVEAARVKVKQAEEAKRQAEIGLRLTTVRVPVLASEGTRTTGGRPASSGGVGTLAPEGTVPREKRSFIVLDRKVALNQEVGPPASAHLFTLAGRLDQMQVQAQVVEGDINKIARGLKATFTTSGGADAEQPTFQGTVEDVRLLPTSEKGAVFYSVIIDVKNQRDPATGDWLLRPGLTASVDIVRRVHEHVWKMPNAALNFTPEPAAITPAAQDKLARWKNGKGHEQWRTVWVPGSDNKPWPIFVKTEGRNAQGQTGIQDAQFSEVLEWDPELQPPPDPDKPQTIPQVIIGMPTHKKGGLFSAPNIKF